MSPCHAIVLHTKVYVKEQTRLTFVVEIALLGHCLVKLLLEAAHLAGRLGDGIFLGLVQANKVSVSQLGCCQLLPHLHSKSSLHTMHSELVNM